LEFLSGTGARYATRLPQSQVAGDNNHYDHNTNDVENIAHGSFSFLARDWAAAYDWGKND
jgi:hypothetical protein